MIIEKEELEKLILTDNLSYAKIAKLYKVSDVTIRNTAIKLGITLPVRKNKINNKICPSCGKDFKPTDSNGGYTECCSVQCAGKLRSKNHYEEYKIDNSIASGQQNMGNYKKFFLIEQNNKCTICGNLNIWNNIELIFILDHIDGDADNNERTNLRLICPNCDSQLDTYKSKNKNSARAKYRQTLKVEDCK